MSTASVSARSLFLLASTTLGCVDLTGAELDASGGTGAESAGLTDGVQSSGSGVDDSGGGSSGGGVDTGNESGVVPGDGLPCDVDAVLTAYCRSCHGDPLVGTTFALLTREDMLALAPSDLGTTVGAKSVERMQNAALPMPPAPATPPTAGDIAVIADWVGAGMPAGDCMPDDTPSPFDADPVCSSDVWWTQGDEEDPRMHPGIACDECHAEEGEGPRLVIGGTVYPSGHEPDDCFGLGEVLVEVTDVNNQVVELHTNSAGNFMLEDEEAPANFSPPYLVKVVSELGERVMAMPAESGDCNTCHTQDGTEDALGRIVAPW